MGIAVNISLLGSFLALISRTTGQNNVCHKPQLGENIDTAAHQLYFAPGEELLLRCSPGYTRVSGPHKIVCTANGEWTKTRYMCRPKRCSYPDPLSNGDLYYEDTVYGSVINYTCAEGYILTGSSTAVCQATGTWSSPTPVCEAVTCGLAPIPQFGMVIYDKTVRGNKTRFGVTGTYRCLPPFALFGNPRAECTADGTWTETPECRIVTCPPPENIDKGFKSNEERGEFDFMETIKYGCDDNYMLEGNTEVVCQQDGKWSETPSCKAPCAVNVQRGRILYKGRKLWVEDLEPKVLTHKEIVSVYCKNTARNCGYAVPAQCIDGGLTIPECFEEPSATTYNLNPGSLPSEIEQC